MRELPFVPMIDRKYLPHAISVCLLLITTLPALSMMVPRVKSFAPGVAAAALIAVVFLNSYVFQLSRAINPYKVLWGLFFFVLAIGLQGLIASMMMASFQWGRGISSVVLLSVFWLGALHLYRAAFEVAPDRLALIIRLTFLLLLLVGLASLMGFSWVDHFIFSKSVLFYREPGHYAVAILPLFTFLILVERGWVRGLFLLATVAVGFATQSFTLILGTVTAVIFCMSPLFLVLVIALVASLAMALDPSYYLSRLDFTWDTKHFSPLVYMSGWERAWIDLKLTHGLGVGFQQFGLVGDVGHFQSRIAFLRPDLAELNLKDGSTTGSKLVGEFGVTGIMVLLVYIGVLVREFFVLRFKGQGEAYSTCDYFCLACFLSASTELFIRGMGYMTPGMLLLMVGVIWLFSRGRSLCVPS